VAKYEARLTGDVDTILQTIDQRILGGSMSAKFEDGSDYQTGAVRCAVRVYERYSMFGGNRVSLNVTLIKDGDQVFLSAITSGGSTAVLFKVNTVGESTFLTQLVRAVEPFTTPAG
jgi:hypothetical protein